MSKTRIRYYIVFPNNFQYSTVVVCVQTSIQINHVHSLTLSLAITVLTGQRCLTAYITGSVQTQLHGFALGSQKQSCCIKFGDYSQLVKINTIFTCYTVATLSTLNWIKYAQYNLIYRQPKLAEEEQQIEYFAAPSSLQGEAK